MSAPSNCNPCCSTDVTTQVPGIQGDPGADGKDGSDGINSFTITTQPFSLPSAGSGVTVNVANSSWMVFGQNIYISDGSNVANFTVASIPGTTTAVLTFLGYTGDSGTGTTINSGAGVSPGGVEGAEGSAGSTVTGTISAAVGLSQALDATPNTQAGSVSLTLGATGKKYLLFARARFDYNGATIETSGPIITLKIRRTNNTPGDVTNAVGNAQAALVTTVTNTAGEITIIAIPYTTQGASDIVQPMVSVDSLANVSAGEIDLVECSISAALLT